MKVCHKDFKATLPEGQVSCFTLSNMSGMEVTLCNWGARIIQIIVPDATGKPGDVTMGYAGIRQSMAGNVEMGALIGRCANRIAKGRFSLGGKAYQLARNNGDNHLHGGFGGTMRKLFTVSAQTESSICFSTALADEEDGYPGDMKLSATYSLREDNSLRMELEATTNQPTPVNLCNHVYFNLGNDPDILDHVLQINAEFYTPVDEGLIPTGSIAPVRSTPFDFTSPHRIGDRIDKDVEQLRVGNGYDHNFVLEKNRALATGLPGENFAARLFCPSSGRILEISTTEPGLQFYSGNFLGKNLTPGRRPIDFRSALCLETQHFPDSVNNPDFPSVILAPGERFESSTTYTFKTV